MNFQFEFWDWMLLLSVTAQSACIAYLYHPKWKALMISLPVPFTMAALAVGQPINATNVAGLALWFIFMHGVRILRQNYYARKLLAAGLACYDADNDWF